MVLLGYSRKYPHTPMDNTELSTQKFQDLFRGNSWNSSQAHRAFITGFPMSSMGGVWIFTGIAHYFPR